MSFMSTALNAVLKNGTSKNPVLQQLTADLLAYDAMGSGTDQLGTRADLLDRIAVNLGLYMTRRHPKYLTSGGLDVASTNVKRRQELYALGTRVNQEFARLKLRTLHGSFAKPDERNYWLERLDPNHRSGHNLARPFKDWYEDQSLNTKSDFFTWLGNHIWSYWGSYFNRNVLYMVDLLGNVDNARRMYFEVHINNNGRFHNVDGDPFHSRDLMTVASGAGWAIVVLSPSDELFMGPHEDSEFHHSTFLGGPPCKCAGEVVTYDSGELFLLTGKSGHYTPTPAEVRNLCQYLKRNNAITKRTLVRPDAQDYKGGPVTYKNSVKVYPMADWLADPRYARALLARDVMSAIPNPTRTINADSRSRFFDKIFDPVRDRN